MRGLLIMSVLFALVMLVFLPIGYLWTASTLPQLESEFDIERQLRGYIEGERMGSRAGLQPKMRAPVEWPRPELSKYPKDMVALWISAYDCPTFFQTPRETGGKFGWRMLVGQFGVNLAGDGACERLFAWRIAEALHIPKGNARAIAAYKIQGLLQKDQLVAYNLATVVFERALIGVEDGSIVLFRRPIDQLSLEELAELQLAMAPYYYYADLLACTNASLLRQARDSVLGNLAAQGLIPDDRKRAAMARSVACLNIK